MYNKYIGNTGKFIRVEDHPGGGVHRQYRPAASPPPIHHQPQAPPPPPPPPPPEPVLKNKTLLGGLSGGLNGLLGGLGGGFKGLSGVFDHLPFGLDLGDILLFLLLLFLFLESGDEEFIIILAVIAFSVFKER